MLCWLVQYMLLKLIQNFQSINKTAIHRITNHKILAPNDNRDRDEGMEGQERIQLRRGWIGLWIDKIRMGSDCFEFSDFRRKPFWAGTWWKYECGNGPFPQISFYSQTLRFVKSDKNKFLITPRAWQYINSTSCERMLQHRFSSSLCWMML